MGETMNLWQLPFIGYGLIIIGIVVGLLQVGPSWIIGTLIILLGVSIVIWPGSDERR